MMESCFNCAKDAGDTQLELNIVSDNYKCLSGVSVYEYEIKIILFKPKNIELLFN